MSYAKETLEYREVAYHILKYIGAIGTCPVHEDEWWFDNNCPFCEED
ncbi:MAG: hypothetical protein NC340_00280 [Ruminococcus flavefaciens]|nr:hypothetical protein [Ruminococcus flavefaciens]MCM1228548.1 hypothetical protein [Ruminococcus flavefaciens]